MKKIAYLYVFDTLADWEPAYVTAELQSGQCFKDKTLKYEVQTVSVTTDPVRTMGGLKILPDLTLSEFNIYGAGLLILPGGFTWTEPFHAPVFEKVTACLDAHVPVAAICGATVALAANGFLDHRKHTSNDLGYLKATCPNYKGEALYQQIPAATDGDLITAAGVAPLEFSYEILKRLDVFLPETLDAWYKLYKTQSAEYFFALMNSLPKTQS